MEKTTKERLFEDLTVCAEAGSWYDLEQTLAAYLCTGSAPWYDQPDRGEGGR